MRHLIFSLCLLFLSLPSFAAETPWEKADHSEIRLAGGGLYDGRLIAGIHLKFEDGWKTYWRSPGDAGLPVAVNTEGSENLKSAEILWPAPHRSVDFGDLQTFVYKHEVVLPLAITPEDAARPVVLKLAVKYAVCKEICLFIDKTLALNLNAADAPDAAVAAALETLPKPLPEGAATTPTLSADGSIITFTITSPAALKNPDVVIELGPNFRFTQPEITLLENDMKAEVKAPAQALLSDDPLTGKQAVFTLVDDNAAYEWKAVIAGGTAAASAPEQQEEAYGFEYFVLMLGFALLGGFILNIMPCVLPVISLKILSVLKKTGKEMQVVRRGFLITAVGVVASFLLLAAIVVVMQQLGMAIGWGFQFQEPYFIILLCMILTVFTANMFGLFEFSLNHEITSFLHQKTTKESYLSHFLTGAFATLMATPCSAPFLGTAIGFAFSQGVAETFAMFFMMGVGLAIPYLVFAAFPRLVRLFPKPGPWMRHLKTVLGLLLALTIFWLLTVLAGQAEWRLSVMIAFGLAILFLYFMLRPNITSPVFSKILFCGVIGIILLLPLLVASPNVQKSVENGSAWVHFDEPAIAKYVAEGKVVLVDVTADWCLTCKANKLLVLNTLEVQSQLKSPNIISMRADWTNRSPEIGAFLKRSGRYGIPFNVVYGPAAPEGIPLPELLSTSAVLEALEKAK